MSNERKTRMTRQRQVILDELRKVTTHPTASEIYQMVRTKIPNVSLGTVYRNLELLNEQGEIQQLELAGTQRRYDGIADNHYHFRCNCCGRVDDITIDNDKNLDSMINIHESDYTITGHKLELTGKCPKCKTDNSKH